MKTLGKTLSILAVLATASTTALYGATPLIDTIESYTSGTAINGQNNGGFAAWTFTGDAGDAATVDNTQQSPFAPGGSQSIHFLDGQTGTDSLLSRAYDPIFGNNSATDRTISFDYRPVTWGSQNINFQIGAGSTNAIRVAIPKFDGNLTLFTDNSATQTNLGSGLFTSGDWYRLEFTFNDFSPAGANDDTFNLTITGTGGVVYDSTTLNPSGLAFNNDVNFLNTISWGTKNGAGTGTDFYLDNLAVSTVIPEPSSVALLGLGLTGLLMRRRCRA